MKYRKVHPKIWNDEKFNALSDKGKLVFFFLLTHPHMTPLGAMRGTIPGLAAELNWTTEAFQEAFQEGYMKGMIEHDPKALFIALPHFIKHNPPESPNVIKAWEKCIDDIPECQCKVMLLQNVKGYTKGLSKGFREAFAKTMLNQEQEQEQEQDLKEKNTKKENPETPKKEPTKNTEPEPTPQKTQYRDFVFLTEAEYSRLIVDFGETQTKTMLDTLDNYIGAKPKTRNGYVDHNRVLRGWVLEKYQEKHNSKNGGNGNGNEFSGKEYTGTPIENISWVNDADMP